MKTLNWKRTNRDLAKGIYVLVSEGGQLWDVNWDRSYLDKTIRERDDLGSEWKVKKMVLASPSKEKNDG